MILHFDIKFEEYKEAHAVVVERTRKRHRNPILGVAVSVVLVLCLFVVSRLWESTGTDPMVVWLHIYLPGIAFILLQTIFNAFSIYRPSRRPRLNKRALFTFAYGIVFFTFITCCLLLLSHIPGPTSPLRNLSWSMLLPHTTWLLALFIISLLIIVNRRRTVRREWKFRTAALARPQTAEITVEGITLSDLFRRLDYQ
ncbi:MAG: hypothetical protein ABSF29_16380, partial [Tepidisphaeraceae bacterium]